MAFESGTVCDVKFQSSANGLVRGLVKLLKGREPSS